MQFEHSLPHEVAGHDEDGLLRDRQPHILEDDDQEELGRRYGTDVLERFRRLIWATPQSFEAMRRFVERYGSLGVFSARFVAGLRFMAGPRAGAMSLGIPPFVIANVLGALAFVPLAVGAGYAIGYGFGDSVERMRRPIGKVESDVLAAAVISIGVICVWQSLTNVGCARLVVSRLGRGCSPPALQGQEVYHGGNRSSNQLTAFEV